MSPRPRRRGANATRPFSRPLTFVGFVTALLAISADPVRPNIFALALGAVLLLSGVAARQRDLASASRSIAALVGGLVGGALGLLALIAVMHAHGAVDMSAEMRDAVPKLLPAAAACGFLLGAAWPGPWWRAVLVLGWGQLLTLYFGIETPSAMLVLPMIALAVTGVAAVAGTMTRMRLRPT